MTALKFCKVNAILKWKGAQTLLFKEAEIPYLSSSNDYLTQYIEIWNILQTYVLEMNAKRVLEFGTREGYSTRLFADALHRTGGHIWSVDINQHKMTPQELEGFDNITFLKEDVMKLDWKIPVDILYIDDWHDPYHVYAELDRWAHLARVIMIHDVIQGCEDSNGILKGIIHWCVVNYMPYSFIPANACGLIIIEKSRFEKLSHPRLILSDDDVNKEVQGENVSANTGNSLENQTVGDKTAGL